MNDKYLSALIIKEKEVFNKISSFGKISLAHDTTLLDGDYTAEDLHIIANAMDELKEIRSRLEG